MILFTKKEFIAAKPYMIAITPYIFISLARDLVKLFFTAFHDTWKNYFDAAIFFSAVWLVALLIINKRQQKALQTEKLRTKEEEEQKSIMAKLKDELEIQVAERTAEITLQKDELQRTLDELKSAQKQLIHSEKMASLGELTAGIAHEIQNPLNFVNNFSEVNKELVEELNAERLKQKAERNEQLENELLNNIKENSEKINYHGKRAGDIVKGMLQHSRTSSGQKELTDINALCDEYLRLAYHGLRAKDKTFNAKFETDFDNTIEKINIVPQDMGRVILNLINNAFYAVSEKKKTADENYEPTVEVITKAIKPPSGSLGVLVSVRDNGPGIPQKTLDKIFQPFFTTKPTGLGTGLGLSLSYDIVKAHGGEIKVLTKEGEGATFTVQLPAG